MGGLNLTDDVELLKYVCEILANYSLANEYNYAPPENVVACLLKDMGLKVDVENDRENNLYCILMARNLIIKKIV